MPWSRTSASSSAVSSSLSGGSDRACADEDLRSVTSLLVTRSPRRALDVVLAPETCSQLLARAGSLATGGALRGHLDRRPRRAGLSPNTAPTSPPSIHRPPWRTVTSRVRSRPSSRVRTMCFGGVSSRADEHAAQVPADEPGLDLVASADPAGRPADVAEPADGREPVGVLDVGDDRERLLGRHRQGDVGACLDHGGRCLVHHCREDVRRPEARAARTRAARSRCTG